MGCQSAGIDPPLLANRLSLALDVGKERGVTFALQPYPDQRTKDNLEAHGQLEHCRRSARDDASLIQQVLRKNEKEPCLVLEHFCTPVSGYVHMMRKFWRMHA